FAAGARIDKASGPAIRKDQIEASLVARDADVDPVGIPFPHLPGKIRIRQHRARHGDQIAVARREDRLGDIGRVDTIGSHHGNTDNLLQPRGGKAPGGARYRIGDGRDPRLVPPDPGIEDVGARYFDPARQPIDLLAGSAALDEIGRGNAIDDQELRAGRRAHALDQFDGQPMAVLLRPSPLIAAVVGSQHREFVDQIAFRSHDLDAIEAGLPGQHRAADVIRYRLLDLDDAHGARRKLVDARRNVGRTETFLLARIATGMQDLQADLAAMLVNRFGDALQFPRLRVLGEYRPTGL